MKRVHWLENLLISLILGFIITSCNQNLPEINTGDKGVNQAVENIEIKNSVDTNAILNRISLKEYLLREQYGKVTSSEQIRQLKDSINYDSIIESRSFSVFDKPNSVKNLNK